MHNGKPGKSTDPFPSTLGPRLVLNDAPCRLEGMKLKAEGLLRLRSTNDIREFFEVGVMFKIEAEL